MFYLSLPGTGFSISSAGKYPNIEVGTPLRLNSHQ